MQAWEDFIKKREQLLGKEAADKWLRSLKVVHFDSGNLYLEAKDSFQILWFEEHIRPLLRAELLNNNFRPIKVHLTIGDTPQEISAKSAKKDKIPSATPFFQDKLDPVMTLDNFVPGTANQVVYRLFCELAGARYDSGAAALATFNPVYLWGGPGAGKTHLLVALTHALKKRGLNALYVRAETFTEHVVSAIRSSEMKPFRVAYRHVDVLIVDDVHVFARKGATQEEFFHTFNALHSTSRQIVLSSKCAPALLEEIEPRLVSRFEWGINVHLEKLKNDDLKQVLQKRCEGLHFPLSQEVADFLLEAFPSSISLHRALEALILRCHLETDARHKRNSRSISLESAKRMLADLSAEEIKTQLTPEKIIACVSAKFGIRSEDLLGKSQSQECSLPRQIAMYLCRCELKLSFPSLGIIFSRDHSTVMTSIKQIEKKVTSADRELLSSLSDIRSNIEN